MLLPDNFFHIGIVVPNINQAIADYKNTAGLAFTDVATTELTLTNPTSGQRETVELKVAYSRTASPYIELIEAVGDMVFSAKNTKQILYYGVWEADIEKRIQQLDANGLAIDALISQGDANPTAIITAPDAYGVRTEYVTHKIQAYIKAWTLTGKVPSENTLSSLLTDIFGVFYFFKNSIKR